MSTKDNEIFDGIMEGLEEAIDHAKSGDDSKVKKTKMPLKIYRPYKKFSAEEIIAFRKKLGLSQEKFAIILGAHVDSLRSWEQDRREIPGGQARLLELLFKDERLIEEFERKQA